LAVILSTKYGRSILDVPNARSLHAVPVPRVGGVGLMAGIWSGWMFAAGTLPWWLWAPMLGLSLVSLLDDKRGLPVWQRLFTHLVAAIILVAGLGLLEQQGLAWGVGALFLAVWSINLYNFMDGSDGLAGGMALFGFASYGVAGLLAQDEALGMLNLAVAAAAAGFLLFNFHPAKVFMGDVGSIPLGFLVAAMGLWGWQRGVWEFWFPFLVFSPFVVDASVTLVTRWIRGMRITEAHRDHYYQRAVRMGLGHRQVALAEYALMVASGGSALWVSQKGGLWQMLLVWVLAYVVLMALLDSRWKRHSADIR
jgi:UDP-N-acetylmuramyl pentapeptide phosphotransferase/UDP-N-acetylglucosamine-1-phosphate transferase